MDTIAKLHFSPHAVCRYQSLIGLAMLLMAVAPIRWLISSWFEASLDSQGFWVFLLCVVLFVWSISSPLQTAKHPPQSFAISLLLLTSLIRAISQLCAVNVLGAVALAVDVYALALLFGLSQRKNALSAGWLAVLFSFSLPIERILQRLIGFALQHLSADGACLVLQSFFSEVQCLGIRILLAGRDVLVDLPCSGIKSITLLCVLYVALMTVFRPRWLMALLVGVMTIVSALLANVIRISFLATFIAYPEKLAGINVMQQPYHDVIGLVCLLLAALPLLFVGTSSLSRTDVTTVEYAPHTFIHSRKIKKHGNLAAIGFLLLAVLIISLPRKALDIADNQSPLNLPVYLDSQYAQAINLTQQEQSYFTQFGGTAIKRRYGDSSVLLIRSNSPLRHLHTPDDCLRGLGFAVQYQAVRYQPLPTVTYLATAKDGSQWRVAVSFYSEHKQFTTNVSEVVWRWLQQPHSTWYALQRITPVSIPESKARDFDNALVAALDLNYQENSHVTSH